MLPSPHRLALARLALAVSAFLVGCPSKSAPTPAPAPSATSASRADLFASPDDPLLPLASPEDAGPGGAAGGGNGAGEPDRGLVIALKDAGAEPRTPLTYDLAIGQPQTVVINFTTTVKQDGDPRGSSDGTPPVRLTLAVVAGEKSADRTLLQARVTKAEIAPGVKGIPPEAAAQMKELSAALQAISATFAVSKRGVIDAAELAGDPETQAAASSLLPLIENALDLFFVPVPEEAVGLGAEWTVVNPPAPGAPHGGAARTYVLKARTPTTATIQEERHEETPAQPIEDPEAPPGSTIAVVTKAGATLNVRLTGVAAKASSDEDSVITAHDPTSSPPKVVVTRMKRSVRLEGR